MAYAALGETRDSPNHAIMAELPRGSDTSDEVCVYLRKLVMQMM